MRAFFEHLSFYLKNQKLVIIIDEFDGIPTPRQQSVIFYIPCAAGVRFNLRNEVISLLATYGVLKKSSEGLCEIANPIYQYCIRSQFCC